MLLTSVHSKTCIVVSFDPSNFLIICLFLRTVDNTFQMISPTVDLVTNLESVSGLEEKDDADHVIPSSEFSTSV